MNEQQIAQTLINTYKTMKAQDKRTIACAENLNKAYYKKCNFELLKNILEKEGYIMNFNQNEFGHKFLEITPYNP